MFNSPFKARESKRKKRGGSKSVLTFDSLEPRHLRASFFVDAVNGSDSNPGTSEQPFQTYLPLVWAYDQAEGANIGTVDLQAGDEVVFREGNYTATFQNPSDRNTGIHRGFYLRGLNGTEENPIVIRAEEGAIIDPSPEDGSEHFSVEIEQSEHVQLSGFEITGLGTGIFVSQSSDIEIFNNWIHDIDGAAIDNLSGINLTANDGLIEVYENLFHDIYDRNNGASENSRAFAAFNNAGSDIRVFNNTVFNSVPIDAEFTGGGIITKHGSDSQFSIQYNVIDQIRNEAIGTSNPNTTIAHNLILRSDGVSIRDFGGPAFFNNITVENNSFIQTDHALQYNPSDFWYPNSSYDAIGAFRFLNNLVDDQGLQTNDQATLAIGLGPGTNAEIAEAIFRKGNLEFDGNVYSHSEESFGAVLFPYLNGYQRDYAFEDWQANGFELSGQEFDFELDSFFATEGPASINAGWFAGEDSRLTIFATDAEGEVVLAPQVASGQIQRFTLVRSGDDLDRLNQELTVELSANSSLLQLPQTITFRPGQTHLQIEALVGGEGLENGERAIRISADASGTLNNVDAWIRVSGSSDPAGNQTPPTTFVEDDANRTDSNSGSDEGTPETEPMTTEGLDTPLNVLDDGRIVLLNEDFADGTIDGDNIVVPPLDRFSNIVETEEGNQVFEITYETDEFQRDISWIGEAFDSIEVSFRSRLPDGIPIGEHQRPWVDLKHFRVFEDTGELGDVFTTVVDRYDARFENRGFEQWQVVHLYGNDVTPVRVDVDAPFTDWVDFRYYMKWNAPGESDGVLMIWQNDQLVFEDQSVKWFENNDLRPNGWWLGGNISGGNHGQDIATVRRQIDTAYVAINGDIPETEISNEIILHETEGSTRVSEGDAADVVGVSLSHAPDEDVFVELSPAVNDQLILDSERLIFTAENWNVPQQVSISALDDRTVEETNSVDLVFGIAADSDVAWIGVQESSINIFVADNDTIDEDSESGYPKGLLTLPGESGDVVSLDFQWLQRFAEYDNEFGFLVADDALGTVDGVSADSAQYAASVLSHPSRRVIFESGAGTGAEAQFNVAAGSHLVFYLVQNATTERFLVENPQNSLQSGPVVFFSIAEANPDNFGHVRIEEISEGTWSFGWEDLANGGDQSFTDAVIELGVQVETEQENTAPAEAAPEIVLPNSFVNGEPYELTVGENSSITFGATDQDHSVTELTFGLTAVGDASPAVAPTIDAGGVFRWTPTTPGEYRFDISVTDPSGLSDTKTVDFVVSQPEVVVPDNSEDESSELDEETSTEDDTEIVDDDSSTRDDRVETAQRRFATRLWRYIRLAFNSETFSNFASLFDFMRRS